MPLYRIADFLWDIEPRFELVSRICEEYRVELDGGKADFRIRVSEEEINAVLAAVPERSAAYAESICTYGALCNIAASHGAMLLHAAAVKVGDRAYAFSAPSGTGKSTHIKLWRRVYGERVGILNGDKPILREKDGALTVYGTPWCGKEGWNRNDSALFGAMCFVERAEKNRIRLLSHDEAVARVFAQLLKPSAPEGLAETLRMTDLLIRTVPIYLLSCNMSEEAARLSFETMTAPFEKQ